jgi:hypothetical protein
MRSGDRKLLETTSVNGSTVGAPRPYGLPLCFDADGDSACSIGCPSKFYTVKGTGESMTASLCGGNIITNYWGRLIVRAGSTTSSCLDMLCIGTCLMFQLCFLEASLANACCLRPEQEAKI